jgi:plasmid replication initiation protein
MKETKNNSDCMDCDVCNAISLAVTDPYQRQMNFTTNKERKTAEEARVKYVNVCSFPTHL